MNTLNKIKMGESARIKKILGQGIVRRRIMDMGITRGCEVNICNIAPLGDPIVINVRGYELSLRKSDAEMIVIE